MELIIEAVSLTSGALIVFSSCQTAVECKDLGGLTFRDGFAVQKISFNLSFFARVFVFEKKKANVVDRLQSFFG